MVQRAQDVAEELAADVITGRLAPGDTVPAVRTLALQAGCSAGTAARAHSLLRSAGVITGPPRSPALVAPDGVARAVAMSAQTHRLRLCGSDDPALDLLLAAVGPGAERAPGGRGSVAGLSLLAAGVADAAAVHLRDPRTGRCNDPFVRRVLGGGPATLVHLWGREQGIVVPAGNPQNIREVADLAGRTLAWRAPGTASRLLLARLLREAGLAVPPATEVCDSHLGVAVAVAAGAVDAGLAVRSAAVAVDADFVPVEWEDFELAVAPTSANAVAPVLEALAAGAVQQRLSELAGYDLRRCGDTRVAA